MSCNDGARLGSRLFALNLRLAELDEEARRTRMEVVRLAARLDDARLARILETEGPGDPDQLAPELERLGSALARQEALIARVKKSQADARVAYSLHRIRERRRALEPSVEEER